MPKKTKTPQEKKILSYLKDSRGSIANNQKTGRKAVRIRKAHVNKSYRRLINQTLDRHDLSIDDLETCISSLRRKPWKKISDPRLITFLDQNWCNSSRTRTSRVYRYSKKRKSAVEKLVKNRGQYAWRLGRY